MSCARWRSRLLAENVDEMGQPRRQEFLAHLQGCSSCRRAATEADPTLIFYLLPPARVEDDEVEEIRRTVQAMRRVRALETSWSRRTRRGARVGAVAALVVMAIVLVPQRPESPSPRGIPFAGAVGVGSGLMTIPPAPASAARVELQVELARSAGLAEPTRFPALQRVSLVEISAVPGMRVDRELGNGYRVRFHLASEVSSSAPILTGFQLLQVVDQGEVSLFSADLLPLSSSPLVLGVTAVDEIGNRLWLRLTHSVVGTQSP